MDQEEFEEHVRAALDGLPEDIARGLENVAVVVQGGGIFKRPGSEVAASGLMRDGAIGSTIPR